MLVGEGPGAEEDLQGRPFVGPAGQLLDRALAAAGAPRKTVYIANVVKCRPPGNRVPRPEEAGACLPWLRRQVEIVRPKVLLLLGATALLYLAGLEGITRHRGKWAEAWGIPAMPTYHPAALLRDPSKKRPFWRDLLAAVDRCRAE
jgi:DNA polymerase